VIIQRQAVQESLKDQGVDLKTIKIWFCGVLFAVSSAWLMIAYVSGPLNGHFNKYLMPARIFGIPAELQQRGIEPLYSNADSLGWDGQFYFYIANDLLARKDTPRHMDADAYRYQRVGVPLVAKMLSVVLGQDWVSPAIYYAVQFALIFLATLLAADFFTKQSLSPFWVLPWSLAAGTQITLLNGLPDGSADALLIMSVIFLWRKNYALYAITATLACLSREAYALLPLSISAVYLLFFWQKPKARLRIYQYGCLLIPIVLFGAWQVFIRLRFAHSPGEQGIGVLGLPFLRLSELLFGGLSGHYPRLPNGRESYLAGAGVVLFVLVMLSAVWSASKIKAGEAFERSFPLPIAIKGFVLILSALYFCFGDTVMWHFTGYMKAAGLLIFMIPFMFSMQTEKSSHYWIAFLFVIATLFFGWQVVKMRILQPPIIYKADTHCGNVQFAPGDVCKERFVWLGKELPGVVGKIAGSTREAMEPRDRVGFLTYGPYMDMPKGTYHIVLSYSGVGENLGYMEIFSLSGGPQGKVFQKIYLPAASDGAAEATLIVNEDLIKSVEVRVQHEHGALTVKSLLIEKN